MQKIDFQNYPDTTTPIDADNLNDLQDNVEEAIDLTNTYLTNETIVGKWINNKPIYRKVVDCGNLPNNSIKNVNHNINNLEFVTELRLMVTTGSSFYQANITGIEGIYSGKTVVIRANLTQIQIGTSYDYSSHSGYAIIEYTKTND